MCVNALRPPPYSMCPSLSDPRVVAAVVTLALTILSALTFPIFPNASITFTAIMAGTTICLGALFTALCLSTLPRQISLPNFVQKVLDWGDNEATTHTDVPRMRFFEGDRPIEDTAERREAFFRPYGERFPLLKEITNQRIGLQLQMDLTQQGLLQQACQTPYHCVRFLPQRNEGLIVKFFFLLCPLEERRKLRVTVKINILTRSTQIFIQS